MDMLVNNYNGNFETVNLDDDVLAVIDKLDVGDGVYVEACYGFSDEFAYLGAAKLKELYDGYMDFYEDHPFESYIYCKLKGINPYDTEYFNYMSEVEEHFLELAHNEVEGWGLSERIEFFFDYKKYAKHLQVDYEIAALQDGYLVIYRGKK